MQQALGYSALRAGLAVVPTTVILIAGGFASRQLVAVIGGRLQLLIGGAITAAGTAWLALAPAHPAYLAHILGPALVAGVGLSLMLLPVTMAGTAGVSPRDAGAAAGLLNTSRQLGGAIGLAVLVTVAATATSAGQRPLRLTLPPSSTATTSPSSPPLASCSSPPWWPWPCPPRLTP